MKLHKEQTNLAFAVFWLLRKFLQCGKIYKKLSPLLGEYFGDGDNFLMRGT